MELSPETILYKTAENCELNLDVYLPPDAKGTLPVIVWVHGGALIHGNRTGIRENHFRRYLQSGLAVVSIDYRLAPETKLPGIIEDLQDAFRWVNSEGAARFGFDPQRIGVVGHSAGGYLTLMAGFCVAPRPRAMVTFYGYGDILGDWYTRPDPFYRQQDLVTKEDAYRNVGGPAVCSDGGRAEGTPIYLYCRQNGLWTREVGGVDPVENPEFFRPYCPAFNVTADYPPTLLLHGDADTDVPHAQSVQMAKALTEAGVENELITIPDGPHGFDGNDEDPVVAAAFEKALAFLKKHLT